MTALHMFAIDRLRETLLRLLSLSNPLTLEQQLDGDRHGELDALTGENLVEKCRKTESCSWNELVFFFSSRRE